MSKTEWKEYEMSELIEEISMGPFGSNIKVECFTDSGVPVLNGSNLVGFRLNEDSFNYVTEEKATSLGKANAYRGDIVITHRGTLGQIVYIPQNSKYSRYVISQSQFRVRCNEKVIPEYLVYYFHSRLGQHKLLSNASQVGVPSLARPTSTFQKLTIEIPSIERQKEIVKILSALDDKIELNNAINRNLEEQAQAIFKSWFVDFEPFDGEMPEDWKLYKLSNFLPVVTGKKNANISVLNGTYPFFSCSQDVLWTDCYSFDGNAILVAGNGDFNVKFYNGKFEAYQRTYVLIPFEKRYAAWLYYAVKYNLDDITKGARGSVIKFITKGDLENFEFAAPQKLDSFKLLNIFDSINKIIESMKYENSQLSTLRDTLLAKLMSGEFGV